MQEILLKELSDKFYSRREASKFLELDEHVLNNFINQKRKVLELANGDYILINKHTKIFSMPQDKVKKL